MTIRKINNREQLKKLVKYTFLSILIPFSEILSSSRDNHNHNRNNQNCTFINASSVQDRFNNSTTVGQNLQQHPQPQYPTQWDFDNHMQYNQTQNHIYMPPNLVWQQPSQVVYISPQYNQNIRPGIQQQCNLPSQAMGVYPNYNTPQGVFFSHCIPQQPIAFNNSQLQNYTYQQFNSLLLPNNQIQQGSFGNQPQPVVYANPQVCQSQRINYPNLQQQCSLKEKFQKVLSLLKKTGIITTNEEINNENISKLRKIFNITISSQIQKNALLKQKYSSDTKVYRNLPQYLKAIQTIELLSKFNSINFISKVNYSKDILQALTNLEAGLNSLKLNFYNNDLGSKSIYSSEQFLKDFGEYIELLFKKITKLKDIIINNTTEESSKFITYMVKKGYNRQELSEYVAYKHPDSPKTNFWLLYHRLRYLITLNSFSKLLQETFLEYTGITIKEDISENNMCKQPTFLNDLKAQFTINQNLLKNKLDIEICNIKEANTILSQFYNIDKDNCIEKENKKVSDSISDLVCGSNIFYIYMSMNIIADFVKNSTLAILYSNIGQKIYDDNFKIYDYEGAVKNLGNNKQNNQYIKLLEVKNLSVDVRRDIKKNIFNELLSDNYHYHRMYKEMFDEINVNKKVEINYKEFINVITFGSNINYRINKKHPYGKYIIYLIEIDTFFSSQLRSECCDKFIELLLIPNIKKQSLINFVYDNRQGYLRYIFGKAIEALKPGQDIKCYPSNNDLFIGCQIANLGISSAMDLARELGKKDFLEGRTQDMNRHFGNGNSNKVLSNEAFSFAKNNGFYEIKPNYKEFRKFYDLGFTHCDFKRHYDRGYESSREEVRGKKRRRRKRGSKKATSNKNKSVNINDKNPRIVSTTNSKVLGKSNYEKKEEQCIFNNKTRKVNRKDKKQQKEREIIRGILSGKFYVSIDQKAFYNQYQLEPYYMYCMESSCRDGNGEIISLEELRYLRHFMYNSIEIYDMHAVLILNLFKPRNFVHDISIENPESEESILLDDLFIPNEHKNSLRSYDDFNRYELLQLRKKIERDVLSGGFENTLLKKSGHIISASPSIMISEIDEKNLSENYEKLGEILLNPAKYIIQRKGEPFKRLIISSEMDAVTYIETPYPETLSSGMFSFRSGNILTIQEYKANIKADSVRKTKSQLYRGLWALFSCGITKHIDSVKQKETSFGYIIHNSSLNCRLLTPVNFKQIKKKHSNIYEESRKYNEFHRVIIEDVIISFLNKLKKQIKNEFFKGYNPHITSRKFLSKFFVKLVVSRKREQNIRIHESILYYNIGAVAAKFDFSITDISNNPFSLPNKSI